MSNIRCYSCNYTMKTFSLLLALIISLPAFAQHKRAPVHGMVYGAKPDTTVLMPASKVESFMDKKTRITVAIRGKILAVKSDSFTIDAGAGKTIAAHFTKAGIKIPASLTGKTVILDGIAQKQFIADDKQHFAGDTVNGKKQSYVNANPKRRLTFEVKGMMVD
jgi:pectate lyase